MSQPNPYAAPQVQHSFAEQPFKAEGFPGLWREGNVLVMHKQAPLPDICMKSNLPANRRLRRDLRWHHPAVFVALLVNLIVYLIIAMIMTKKATIHMPLTDEWFGRRRTRMLIAWGVALLAVLMFFGGIAAIDTDYGIFITLAGLFVALGAGIGGLLGCQLVTPKRMTDQYIWLKGVHPDYLDRLPVWPYRI